MLILVLPFEIFMLDQDAGTAQLKARHPLNCVGTVSKSLVVASVLTFTISIKLMTRFSFKFSYSILILLLTFRIIYGAIWLEFLINILSFCNTQKAMILSFQTWFALYS